MKLSHLDILIALKYFSTSYSKISRQILINGLKGRKNGMNNF